MSEFSRFAHAVRTRFDQTAQQSLSVEEIQARLDALGI